MTEIDLTQYPPPDVLEALSFETILGEVQALFLNELPTDDATAAAQKLPTRAKMEETLKIQGNLVAKILQAYSYHAMIMRQRVNDAAKASFLATSTGADLDNLAAFYGLQRNVTNPDDVANGGLPVMELDADFRKRIIPAVDGFSTAGPIKAYEYWSATVEGVRNASAISPNPGEVLVSLLGYSANGLPAAGVVEEVNTILNSEDIRPLTDQVTVQAGTLTDYTIVARLTFFPGVGRDMALEAAQTAIEKFVADSQLLGYDITRSEIFKALHQEGVHNVNLTEPAADLIFAKTHAGNCTNIALTDGGVDE